MKFFGYPLIVNSCETGNYWTIRYGQHHHASDKAIITIYY